MKNEFIQAMFNKKVEDALTTRFSVLKPGEVDPEEIKRALKKLQRDGTIAMLKESDQDPEELGKMLMIAYDSACKSIREKLEKVSTAIIEAVKEEVKKVN